MGGLIQAITLGSPAASEATFHRIQGLESHAFRIQMIISLLLPQVALTLANSVLGTQNAADRYLGSKAKQVTASRLLYSIGLGNLVCAVIGGLPFCHGSGGLTAHIKGGASHWRMNAIIGSTLLCLAVFHGLGNRFELRYPPLLLSTLLIVTGVFHIGLARPTWVNPDERWKAIAAAGVISLTHNMIWVLIAGCLAEMIDYCRNRNPKFQKSKGILRLR